MTFQKGNNANPAGRPKNDRMFKRHLIQALKDRSDTRDEGETLRRIADRMIDEALIGESALQASLAIRDTIDGKPAQAITGDEDNPVAVKHTFGWKKSEG